jgi:hypothetical protein
MPVIDGHAFLSYVRENGNEVDKIQRALEAAGVPVWRDTANLWPGEDWRTRIRRAISDDALVFIACFSVAGVARFKSYQNEELTLAIEQLRQRNPDRPWLIPVRIDDCLVPDLDLGAGRTLASIQQIDLFGDMRDVAMVRLVMAVLRILGEPSSGVKAKLPAQDTPTNADTSPAESPFRETARGAIDAFGDPVMRALANRWLKPRK